MSVAGSRWAHLLSGDRKASWRALAAEAASRAARPREAGRRPPHSPAECRRTGGTPRARNPRAPRAARRHGQEAAPPPSAGLRAGGARGRRGDRGHGGPPPLPRRAAGARARARRAGDAQRLPSSPPRRWRRRPEAGRSERTRHFRRAASVMAALRLVARVRMPTSMAPALRCRGDGRQQGVGSRPSSAARANPSPRHADQRRCGSGRRIGSLAASRRRLPAARPLAGHHRPWLRPCRQTARKRLSRPSASRRCRR